MHKENEKKALGIVSILLGTFALIMSFFLATGGFAFLLGVLSLIFGISALIINRKNKLLIALIGTTISLLSIFIALIVLSAHNASLANSKENESSVSSSSSSASVYDNDSSASSISPTTKDTPVGESTSLGAGTWTVGKDIKPGIYVLTTSAGSGNVSSDDSKSDDINIILSSTMDDPDSQMTNYRAILSDGQKIKIEGLQSVNFQVDKPLGNVGTEKYISGQYIVGEDIKPGRYEISADLGSGNLMTDDGAINEILSTNPEDNEISSTTVNLTKGQVLSTNLNRIQLTQK